MINAIRAVLAEMIGLFVADWGETAGMVAVVAAVALAAPHVTLPGLGFVIAGGIAAILIISAVRAGR